MSKARFKMEDVWLCGVCHSWQMVGQKCKCGLLSLEAEKRDLEAKEEKPKKPRAKTRKPASEGTFTKSYFFPEGGEK